MIRLAANSGKSHRQEFRQVFGHLDTQSDSPQGCLDLAERQRAAVSRRRVDLAPCRIGRRMTCLVHLRQLTETETRCSFRTPFRSETEFGGSWRDDRGLPQGPRDLRFVPQVPDARWLLRWG